MDVTDILATLAHGMNHNLTTLLSVVTFVMVWRLNTAVAVILTRLQAVERNNLGIDDAAD